ncbi:MAG: hypothetical protein HUJ27_00440 [Rhodobacteraceae bacterium]|nr:hypothetical protein [Paracoccaceae bacterium]
MRIKAVIIPMVAIMLLGGASQFGPQDCVSDYIHHSNLAPTDFGNGIVLEHQEHVGYHSPTDYWGAKRVTLVDCARGREIQLTRSARNGAGWRVVRRERAVQRLLDGGEGLRPDELFAYVEERAEKSRIPIEQSTFETETCGCRAFYPELRGDKKRYEV